MAKKNKPDHDATQVRWLAEPQAHDYPAAAAYLGLVAAPDVVAGLVERLHNTVIETHKAKDILRAARLPLLDASNPHVSADLAKIGDGEPLSPILLVRGYLGGGLALQIADGYHRVCACYRTDENIDIPCALVDL